jgi:hypothetical protein
MRASLMLLLLQLLLLLNEHLIMQISGVKRGSGERGDTTTTQRRGATQHGTSRH